MKKILDYAGILNSEHILHFSFQWKVGYEWYLKYIWPYRYFHDHNKRVGRKGKSDPTKCVCINLEWLLPHSHIPTTGTQTDDNMELDGRKWDYWEPNSLWINYLHQRLLFQKRQLFFQGLSWVFLFLILAHCGKNHILSKHASFGISQFASDYLKWKLMWHFKQSMARPVTQWLHLVSVASWGIQLSALWLKIT